MQVTRCDRCGEVTEKPVTMSVKENAREARVAREYDLCENCRKELDEFLEGKATGGIR